MQFIEIAYLQYLYFILAFFASELIQNQTSLIFFWAHCILKGWSVNDSYCYLQLAEMFTECLLEDIQRFPCSLIENLYMSVLYKSVLYFKWLTRDRRLGIIYALIRHTIYLLKELAFKKYKLKTMSLIFFTKAIRQCLNSNKLFVYILHSDESQSLHIFQSSPSQVLFVKCYSLKNK